MEKPSELSFLSAAPRTETGEPVLDIPAIPMTPAPRAAAPAEPAPRRRRARAGSRSPRPARPRAAAAPRPAAGDDAITAALAGVNRCMEALAHAVEAERRELERLRASLSA